MVSWPLKLDSQNRVLGTLHLLASYRPNNYWWGLPEACFQSHMGQWAQPFLGTTVSATQLSKQAGFLAAASPSGDKLVADRLGLYDRATEVFQIIPGGMHPTDANNSGTVIGVISNDPTPPGEPVSDSNNPSAWTRALTCTPGQSVITLPTGNFTGAGAYAINNSGVIVGAIYKDKAPSQVNASGTVIGIVYAEPPPPGGTYKSPRAYIWQNGQMQDLTTLVASKGVKLPAGTVLNNVVSINDQGSLVVGFEHPSTEKQTYVRLQAKP